MKLFLTFLFAGLGFWASAQNTEKKALRIEDFSQWQHVEQTDLANNGQVVLYLVKPQVGNARLELHNLSKQTQGKMKRVSKAKITFGARYSLCTVVNDYEAERQLKLKKEKKENFPKDSLYLIDNSNFSPRFIDLVKSWKIPETNGRWLAYLRENPLEIETPDSSATEEEKGEDAAAEKTKKESEKLKDTRTLVLYDLSNNNSREFINVKDYGFSKNGSTLYFNTLGDSSFEGGIYVLQTKTGLLNRLPLQAKTYQNLCTDTSGSQLAMVYSMKGEKRKNQAFHLLHYSVLQQKILHDIDTLQLPLGLRISENYNLQFTENGERLLAGLYQKPHNYPVDTTLLDEEKPALDVWSHHDGRLQPQQLEELKADEKKSVLYLMDTKSGELKQVGHHLFSNEHIAQNNEGSYALVSDPEPYFKERSWAYPWARDVYLKNLKSGEETLLFEYFTGSINFSPGGKYLYWFDMDKGLWWLMDLKSQKRTCLTAFKRNAFVDLYDDHPAQPGSYGIGGWLEDDALFFINDQYSFWVFDPKGKKEPVRFDKAPSNKIRARIQNLTNDDYLPADEGFLVHYFNTITKQEKLEKVRYNHKTGGFEREIWQDFKGGNEVIYQFAKQADNGSTCLFYGKSNQQSADLYVKIGDNYKQLSHLNPQQQAYKWYQTELINFLSADGDSLQGILYKPENFDPTKKYPMVVYFYEKMSDYINYYQEPRPSYSTVSRSFYCSNDYFVFVPDIVYSDGEPGRSAFNCIVPGVLKILYDHPYIDAKRMGLQGQSWGGYQTAYLVTQTDLFACGMAGAPVSNMTSAYGGIRWGSGFNRAFQYEHGQSRIGGSLWEKPIEYIENSPLFYANRVNTPLLIMHNDHDGAVPWYQGIEYFTALRRLNKPVWMLVYNNEDHNLTKLPNRIDLSHRMFGFFNYYLKGDAMPLWMKEGIPAIDKGKYSGY